MNIICVFSLYANSNETTILKSSDSLSEPKYIKDHFAEVKNAETDLQVDVNKISKTNSIWVLYQKNCEACHLMMKESSCYNKANQPIYFLGIGSSPESLIKDARTQKYNGPIYYADSSLKTDLNLEVTPTVFIFKKEILFSRANYYLSCKAIKKILNSI